MANSRDAENRDSAALNRKIIGAGVVAAAAGAAAVLWGRRANDGGSGEVISDAPPHVLRGKAAKAAQGDQTLVGKTVTIGKPRQELYEFWREITHFPQFMDNVESVEKLDDTRSRWRIKGPAGTTVELINRLIADVPGKRLGWESEPGSDLDTSGVVEFIDAPPGRGTYVRFLVAYHPPGGVLGQGVAKLLQREPTMQARRDLRRFKQLMETGEVTTNASPSGRKSESPTQPRI
jgi:uncharacterized membrane protein